VVIGAAFGDIILHLDALPQSGSDVSARDGGRQIGGCAFNVARALSRLELFPINAIPVGNGDWGQAVAQKMALENLPVLLRHPTHDNGWCLALVEASKERTFITIEGCEQHWTDELLAQIPLPKEAIIYVSGYELASEALRQWILAQTEDKTLFVDFGPRLCDLDIHFIQALLRKRPCSP
jgi:sugar/nucleoside kinase (ribokinase family)